MLSLLLIVLTFLSFSDLSLARVYTTYADIAKQALPGVVNIRTTGSVQKDRSLDLYEFFLGGKFSSSRKTHSLGSGVVISNKGHIITNSHVIQSANKIELLFANNNKNVEAQVLGVDTKTDLALLKISHKSPISPLDLGDSDKLKVGDIVLAVGNPFGFSHTVTSGIISAKGRVIGSGPYDEFLQTDATIHPGNSGGPLIDLRGRVIGINTAVSNKGSGIGFAIPSNLTKRVIKDLIKFGKVIRPWLGVVGENILADQDLGRNFDNSGVYGVVVSNLIVDGPAHKAGLKIGDLIMEVSQKKVQDTNQLQRILDGHSPDDRIRMKLYRRPKGYLYINLNLREVPRDQDLPSGKLVF